MNRNWAIGRLALLVLLELSAAPVPAAAASFHHADRGPAAPAALGDCALAFNYVAGNEIRPTGAAFGVKSTIVFWGLPELCNENGSPSQSFSSAWVALGGDSFADTDGDNIFQIGIGRCQYGGPSCVGWDANTEYKFWAYGHQANTGCGAAQHPYPQKFGQTGPSSVLYKIKRTTDIDNDPIYAAYVSMTEIVEEPAANLDTCWFNGSKLAQWYNEVFQQNDQSGGTTTSPLQFAGNQYMNGSAVWNSMNFTLNSPCMRHDLATQKCFMSSGTHDTFKSWDSRL